VNTSERRGFALCSSQVPTEGTGVLRAAVAYNIEGGMMSCVMGWSQYRKICCIRE